MLSEQIAKAVERDGPPEGIRPQDVAHPCDGSRHHSPTPLVVREFTMPDGSLTHLCGICADNLAFYQHQRRTHDGNPPWELRREYGNLIRALGDKQ